MSHSETLGAELAPAPPEPPQDPLRRSKALPEPYRPTGYGATVDRLEDLRDAKNSKSLKP